MEPPSFSLGLDLDLDLETPLVAPDSPSRDSSPVLGNDLDDWQLQDSDPGPSARTQSAPIFRRLRRGPSSQKADSAPKRYPEPSSPHDNVDDDIEEFSSQELPPKADEKQTTQQRSMCSRSKFSLNGHMTRTTQSVVTTREQLPDVPTSSAPKNSKRPPPIHSKSAMSPLRQFQLLDSDSDDSFDLMGATKDPVRRNQSTSPNRKRMSFVSPLLKDLWDGHLPKETATSFPTSASVPTPALDNFCEEYFKRVRDKQPTSSSARGSSSSSCAVNRREGFNNMTSSSCQLIDLENGVPPSHCYFFHSDPRIQRLVRSRLPHFQPLGTVNNTGRRQLDASIIDYMSQFGDRGGTKQNVRGQTNPVTKKNSSRSRKNQKSSGIGVTSTSGDWVNLRNLSAPPKDAGQRRVHAKSQSPGHWSTDENGRKVYISKNMQQLTGQMAYRQYKKENGGFRKSKGKTSYKRRKK